MNVRFEFDRDFIAAVTGGASGIGAATVSLFAASGATVYLIDRDDEGARRVAGAAPRGSVTVLSADVSDEASVRAAMARIDAAHGTLDALVASAGVAAHGAAGDLSLDEWERAMGINLRGSWLCAKYALPLLQRRPTSAIVFLASVHAFRTIPRYAAYAVTKAGIVALARSMAIDYAAAGVRVHAVVPGGVDTPMTADVLRAQGAAQDPASFTSRYPLGRFATAEELASAIVWLGAPGCTFMTGSPVIVDGGLMAKL